MMTEPLRTEAKRKRQEVLAEMRGSEPQLQDPGSEPCQATRQTVAEACGNDKRGLALVCSQAHSSPLTSLGNVKWVSMAWRLNKLKGHSLCSELSGF